MTNLPQIQDNNSRDMTPFSRLWLAKLRRAVGEINGRPMLMGGRILTDRERVAIQAEIDRLRSRLSPSPDDRKQKAVALGRLIATYPAGRDHPGVSTDMRMAAYFEAVRASPAWAVDEAARLLIVGEVVRQSSFAPNPPEFSAVVTFVLSPLRRALVDLERIRDAVSDVVGADKSERSRVMSGFTKLRSELEAREEAQ